MLSLDGISAVCRKNISEVAGTGRNGTCALFAEVLHSAKRKIKQFYEDFKGYDSQDSGKKTGNTIFYLISAHVRIIKCTVPNSLRGFHFHKASQMQSFVKMKPWLNCEISLSLTDYVNHALVTKF